MKLAPPDSAFLKSKIARRIFFLFVACALLPIVVLIALTLFHVTSQMEIQSVQRLQQSSKSHGLGIYERLLSMESDMRFMATTLSQSSNGKMFGPLFENLFQDRLNQRFRRIALIRDGEVVDFLGDSEPFNIESAEIIIEKGAKNQILLKKGKKGPAEVYLAVPLAEAASPTAVLIAQINPPYLWGIGHENSLPAMTELAILDQNRELLISSFPMAPSLVQGIAGSSGADDDRYFEYQDEEGNAYLVSFWLLYMKGGFHSPNFTIILRQAKSVVLAPLEDFKTIFPLVVLLSLWIVLLLSMVFIRRFMVPLEKLTEATHHLARRDFSHQIAIKSGDELETLALSFNMMSHQLHKQFSTLETISEISQDILSSLNSKQVIETALIRLSLFLQNDASQLILFKDWKSNLAMVHVYSATGNVASEEMLIEIPALEKKEVLENRHLLRTGGEGLPPYLTTLLGEAMPLILQLPLVQNGTLKGMINFGFKTQQTLDDQDCRAARQMADQITIALENTGLIETLEKMSWGTLQALARTVDAKSPWTAGHSERVTELALKIGGVMGFGKKEIISLHQGALVHDIGKIGIPHIILDKPGKLTRAEFDLVKEHPLIGSRILEPIAPFAEAISMVLHHHERCDGSGYPFGLKGHEVCLGARILAVADVYDAVVSDRPYRVGWAKSKALAHIQEDSGSKFDPEVVKAFLFVVQ